MSHTADTRALFEGHAISKTSGFYFKHFGTPCFLSVSLVLSFFFFIRTGTSTDFRAIQEIPWSFQPDRKQLELYNNTKKKKKKSIDSSSPPDITRACQPFQKHHVFFNST